MNIKTPKITVAVKTPRPELYLWLLINNMKEARLGNTVKLITLTIFFDSKRSDT